MNYTMHDVITNLKNGRLIEAIKIFRSIYGCGLKEAKDAVEAIASALGLRSVAFTPAPAEQFIVVSRYGEHDYDYCVVHYGTKADATAAASDVVGDRHEVYVAKVVAKSVTTRAMKEVA